MKKKFFYIIGGLLIIIAVILLGLTFVPVIKEELKYKRIQGAYQNSDDIVIKLYESDKDQSERISEGTTNIITAADKDFSVVIPKIGVNTKVIKNVDPTNSSSYQIALSKGVAHASNTALPSDPTGNIFIFAHSSDNFYHANLYNSVFYLLNKLASNDAIYIVYNGKVIKYKVKRKSIVNKNDIKYLKNISLDEHADQTLTLMTCWPPGTTLKRLVVVATKQ